MLCRAVLFAKMDLASEYEKSITDTTVFLCTLKEDKNFNVRINRGGRASSFLTFQSLA